MSAKKMESDFNIVVLVLQICLGVWQFTKLTPVGTLIQGIMGWLMGWLLRPFLLSSTYVRLQCCNGRVFKKVNSYVLQADSPSERTGIHRDGVNNIIELNYLGEESRLERSENKLFVKGKLCYYITDRIWEELHTMRDVLDRDLAANSYAARAANAASAAADARAIAAAEARAAEARADADAADARAADASFLAVDPAAAAAAADTAAEFYAEFYADFCADATADADAARAIAADADAARAAADAAARAAAADARIADDADAAADAANAADAAAADTRAATARAAAARAVAAAALYPVFIKSRKDFWEEVIMGGMMRLDEVLDGIILHNLCVSRPLNNHWLLPVDVLVSEEKLLKVFNLFALFLQTKRVKVNSLIPTALSVLSALLEFSTRSRVWLYTCINVGFCYIVNLICDPLPRSWRRHIYSLGKWVENLKPCNDIELKVVRRNITVIITEGAKVEGAKIDNESATLVPWLDVPNEQIEMNIYCDLIGKDILCTYVREYLICEISAPTISDVYVDCKSMDDFKHIVTLVSCIAENCCGSLISYGPKNKVRVRGFKESLISYVKDGLPPIYQLELEKVVVA